MNTIWLAVIGWFLSGLLGTSFKILFWRFNGKKFNMDSGIHTDSITLDMLVGWIFMGPIVVIVGLTELFLLSLEWMSNIEIFK